MNGHSCKIRILTMYLLFKWIFYINFAIEQFVGCNWLSPSMFCPHLDLIRKTNYCAWSTYNEPLCLLRLLTLAPPLIWFVYEHFVDAVERNVIPQTCFWWVWCNLLSTVRIRLLSDMSGFDDCPVCRNRKPIDSIVLNCRKSLGKKLSLMVL